VGVWRRFVEGVVIVKMTVYTSKKSYFAAAAAAAAAAADFANIMCLCDMSVLISG
jgi:hypothetical protein